MIHIAAAIGDYVALKLILQKMSSPIKNVDNVSLNLNNAKHSYVYAGLLI